MSKKLRGNGLFESSRMMLPEHKEAYLLHQQELNRRKLPVLDSQQIERFSWIIAESMMTGKEITLCLYGDFAERRITGRIVRIEQRERKVKIANGWHEEWVDIEKIINIPGFDD
jgi:hypothetical protein